MPGLKYHAPGIGFPPPQDLVLSTPADNIKRMRIVDRVFFLLAVIAVAGCDQALETGYTPKRLNASDSERRAFYAPQFSAESHPSEDQGAAPDSFLNH